MLMSWVILWTVVALIILDFSPHAKTTALLPIAKTLRVSSVGTKSPSDASQRCRTSSLFIPTRDLSTRLQATKLSFEEHVQTLFPSAQASQKLLGILQEALQVEKDSLEDTLIIFQDLSASQITKTLQTDFGVPPLQAHQLRTAISRYFESTPKSNTETPTQGPATPTITDDETSVIASTDDNAVGNTTLSEVDDDHLKNQTVPTYKQVTLTEKAKLRIQNATYGLTVKEIQTQHLKLAQEMDEFYQFMTKPNPYAQEEPIRKATADVYLRHARLFLGWYQKVVHEDPSIPLSIYEAIVTSDRESVTPILEFLQWLRTNRQISVSYEANLLRGLIKLVKFRFCKESNVNDITGSGSHSFDDIPLVRELRKWHRDVGKRQATAPRASDESLKWISWPEYLDVVRKVQEEFKSLQSRDSPTTKSHARMVASAFQKYLILAIFANIPDRQRTIRELELGKNFIQKDGLWCIRHAPEDYKTGKCYGERPIMALPPALSASMDEYLRNHRDALISPSAPHSYVFAQPRTGNPMTQDSVYQIVGRACYKHTGKRTNPHLLRDMIVTHVRESGTATEQQLEALALYMGHSVAIQRASYDRRTLTQKVAPAVELMTAVNQQTPSASNDASSN